MMVNDGATSPADGHLLELAARLYAADAAVTESFDTGPQGWWHWMWRRAAARAAARVRPDVITLAETAWTLLAELSEAEAGHVTAQCAARRLSASRAARPAPAKPRPRAAAAATDGGAT
jgi:hypothetical protein